MRPIESGSKHAEIGIRMPGGTIQTVILEGARYVLGREGMEGLRYPGLAGLSREHLAFERQGQAWAILDLRSTNGTKVNGALITAPQLLQSSDVVTAGPLSIVFTEGAAGPKDRPSTASVVFVESSPIAEESRREATLDGFSQASTRSVIARTCRRWSAPGGNWEATCR